MDSIQASTMDLLSPVEIEAIGLSVRVSLWATAWSLPAATGVAWILARCTFPGKTLFDGIIHLPLVLPPVVVGYVLLVMLGRRGWIGSWLYDVFGFTFAFSWRGAAVAAGVVAFPLVVRAIRLSLEAVDHRLEDAARTLGANPVDVFITVTLPLMAPGILAGAILGFARCLGEFGATITFVSNIPGETQTLSLAIYSLLQSPRGDGDALVLIVAAIALALVSVLFSEWLSERLRWSARS